MTPSATMPAHAASVAFGIPDRAIKRETMVVVIGSTVMKTETVVGATRFDAHA